MESLEKVAVRGFGVRRYRNGFFPVSGRLLDLGNFRALVLSKILLALDGSLQRHNSHPWQSRAGDLEWTESRMTGGATVHVGSQC